MILSLVGWSAGRSVGPALTGDFTVTAPAPGSFSFYFVIGLAHLYATTVAMYPALYCSHFTVGLLF